MKNNDQQLGSPNILFSGTTTELNALSAVQGMIAFDTTLGKQVVYDGSKWVQNNSSIYVVPPPTGWTWVNQNDSYVSHDNDGLFFYSPAYNGIRFALYIRSIPSSPYVIKTCARFLHFQVNYHKLGLVLYESSSGKFIIFGFKINDISILTAASVTSSVTDVLKVTPNAALGDIWLKIEDDGTNRIYSLSIDGTNYVQFYSHTNTTFITPDYYGVCADPYNTNYGVGLKLLSLEES